MANQAIQTLFDWDSIRQAFPDASVAAIDDYYAKTILIRQIINESGPKNGSGSPEGVVTSSISKLYVDTDIPTQYFNPVVGVKTGWVAL